MSDPQKTDPEQTDPEIVEAGDQFFSHVASTPTVINLPRVEIANTDVARQACGWISPEEEHAFWRRVLPWARILTREQARDQVAALCTALVLPNVSPESDAFEYEFWFMGLSYRQQVERMERAIRCAAYSLPASTDLSLREAKSLMIILGAGHATFRKFVAETRLRLADVRQVYELSTECPASSEIHVHSRREDRELGRRGARAYTILLFPPLREGLMREPLRTVDEHAIARDVDRLYKRLKALEVEYRNARPAVWSQKVGAAAASITHRDPRMNITSQMAGETLEQLLNRGRRAKSNEIACALVARMYEFLRLSAKTVARIWRRHRHR